MGWGRDASNVHTSKLQLINTHGWTVYLYWTDKKGKTENTIICLKYFKFNVLDCNTLFSTCQVLKARLLLLRVNFYRIGLKRNKKNYFELPKRSRYRGYEFLKVKV